MHLDTLFIGIVVSVIAEMISWKLQRESEKRMLEDENTTTRDNFLRSKKFKKVTNSILVVFALVGFGYIWIKSTYFPVVLGCVDDRLSVMNVRLKPTEKGGVLDITTGGQCFYFDAQSLDGQWMRIRSDEDSDKAKYDNGWVFVERIRFQQQLPKVDPDDRCAFRIRDFSDGLHLLACFTSP